MAKEVWEYPEAASDMDFDTADGGMPEGMDRDQVNNAARERMRALRNLYYDNLEYLDIMRNPTDGLLYTVSRLSTTVIRIASGANDESAFFKTGRRIKTTTVGVDTDFLFVDSASYSNPNTDVTVTTATVTAGIDGVQLYSAAELGENAFTTGVLGNFTIPQAETAAGIQDAYTSLSPGGGTILLLGETYNLETQLVFDAAYNVTILGQGESSSIMRANDNTDQPETIKVDGGAGGWVRLVGCTVDGNRANQTSGAGDGVLIMDDADQSSMDHLEIIGTRGSGMRVSGSGASSITNIEISNISMRDIGGSGLFSDDANDVNTTVSVVGVYIDGFGLETTLSTLNYGIFATGKGWKISGLRCENLNLGGGFTQVGCGFGERLAADPNPQDGRYSVLSSIYVSGTGNNAVGIACNGEQNSVTGGVIRLTGVNSSGVSLNGSGGSRAPKYNVISGMVFSGMNIGVLLSEAADSNVISDLSIFNPITNGVLVQGGDNNKINNVNVDCNNSGIDAFEVGTNASANHFANCKAQNTIGSAFLLSGGADTRITDFESYNCDTGIKAAAAATGTRVDGVRASLLAPGEALFEAVTGSTGNVLKNTSWDSTGEAYLDPDDDIKFTNVEGLVLHVTAEATLTVVGVVTAMTLTPPPNGTRLYEINLGAHFTSTGSSNGEFNLGPLGTAADPTIGPSPDFVNIHPNYHRILAVAAVDIIVSTNVTVDNGANLIAFGYVKYIEGS